MFVSCFTHATDIEKKPNKPVVVIPADVQHICNNDDDERIPKLVLAQFANMVASFFNIVQDPKNPKVLAPNLINILSGIVNIAVEGLKSGVLTEEETEEIILRVSEVLHEVH